MFLKLSDLARPQMLAVEVVGARLGWPCWRLARLCDLEIGLVEDTSGDWPAISRSVGLIICRADSLQLGQAGGDGGGREPPGGGPEPRESIQLRPGDWRPYTERLLPISASRASLFPLTRANPVLTLLGAAVDSEKEKDLDILGRGGSVKMLLSPFCFKEKKIKICPR